ncbi:hypothetical protein Moror_3309 [Moniliophthora roreri MCA 2997]|uniref:Uncharacterized protein n=1 Tax=Moniliophthora roreri (strain MCA 2997) TaxID=1381753 RepID=V2WSM1_MONRO|nr:hypothetical protein Moror_3309 [Moniliophthora roreri MCA 2997]
MGAFQYTSYLYLRLSSDDAAQYYWSMGQLRRIKADFQLTLFSISFHSFTSSLSRQEKHLLFATTKDEMKTFSPALISFVLAATSFAAVLPRHGDNGAPIIESLSLPQSSESISVTIIDFPSSGVSSGSGEPTIITPIIPTSSISSGISGEPTSVPPTCESSDATGELTGAPSTGVSSSASGEPTGAPSSGGVGDEPTSVPPEGPSSGTPTGEPPSGTVDPTGIPSSSTSGEPITFSSFISGESSDGDCGEATPTGIPPIGFPPIGFPTGLSTKFSTGLPTEFPTGLPTELPTGFPPESPGRGGPSQGHRGPIKGSQVGN